MGRQYNELEKRVQSLEFRLYQSECKHKFVIEGRPTPWRSIEYSDICTKCNYRGKQRTKIDYLNQQIDISKASLAAEKEKSKKLVLTSGVGS